MSFFNEAPAPTEFPLPKPQSKAAREAKSLHDEWVDKYAAIAQREADVQSAIAQVHTAEAELDAELTRAAQSGEASTRDLELARALEDAKGACDTGLHQRRIQAAVIIQVPNGHSARDPR